jgi:hypothetical protein
VRVFVLCFQEYDYDGESEVDVRGVYESLDDAKAEFPGEEWEAHLNFPTIFAKRGFRTDSVWIEPTTFHPAKVKA